MWHASMNIGGGGEQNISITRSIDTRKYKRANSIHKSKQPSKRKKKKRKTFIIKMANLHVRQEYDQQFAGKRANYELA